MFIQTETTPNPATLKFLPGRLVHETGRLDYANPDAAKLSPLARRLFAVDGVTGVHLGTDFITVTKTKGEWQHLKPQILGAIMEHYQSGQPVVEALGEAFESTGEEAPDDEITAQIKELIDTRVRPAVAQDGGDIVFERFEDGIVYLQMHGSCSGCPSSTATLKNGIEQMLKHYVPEVIEVRPV